MGVDCSREALDYIRDHHKGIGVFVGYITTSDFADFGHYDVVIVSHVLEHLDNPGEFLRSMGRSLRFSHAVVEVPLENLLASRVKARFRNPFSNSAGHVQFFDAGSFEDLLRSSGLRIIDRRTYVPVLERDTLRILARKYQWPVYLQFLKLLTSNYFPRLAEPMWKRFYYAHHAVLCTTL
jgi:SAM-dependent methyltransferase